jgi:hypothetical protein
MKVRKVITGYDLVATWNDGETQILDIPNHIASDIDYLLTLIEDEENEDLDNEEEDDDEHQ